MQRKGAEASRSRPSDRPGARVTILDVANAAGVKPSTVSKALNDQRGSADVRRRVEEAAARLGYRPNQRARGLRRSESRSIAVLIPDLANPVYLPFLRGVEHAAREQGYVVLIADGQRSDRVEAAALGRFFDQGVDGLLLGGPVTADALGLYLDHGVPVAPSSSEADRDHERHWERGEAAATRAMAERLLELGHCRFAFAGTPPPLGLRGRSYARSRLGTLKQSLRDTGAELTVAVVDPTRGYDGCEAELRQLVTVGEPTALVCANHLLAPWLLLALDDARRRVPRDASVVVYGDSDWARAYRPPLSVVCHDTYAEGHDLASGLLDTIAGITAPQRAMVTAQYIERGSCGKVKPRCAGRLEP